MTLSIITINLNNANGLRKTIESIVSQTFTDFEHIVIDGGSTDGSIDIIKNFEDKISYWVSEPDNGIYNAMNKGIMKAKGEYLQFLNSGDWLVNEDILKNVFHQVPDSDLIYGNIIKLQTNGKEEIDRGPESSTLTLQTFYRGTINHSSSFIRKELFDKYGYYDENFKIISDWKFFLEVFGFRQMRVIYKNIEICFFDMTGISRTERELVKMERKMVLNDTIPHPILLDYQNHISFLNKLEIINKHSITRGLLSITQKLCLKLSKNLDRIKYYLKN